MFLAFVIGVRSFILQLPLIIEEPFFRLIADSIRLVIISNIAFERQRLVEIMILMTVEMPMRIYTPRHTSQLLQIISVVFLPELVIRFDPRVI